jgi:hypothetical protein
MRVSEVSFDRQRGSEMSKTLGQIADAVWTESDAAHDPGESWDLAADAVVEECIRVITDDFHWMLPFYSDDKLNMETDAAAESVRDQIISVLQALKATSSDAGLRSPQGDERPTEDANASLTQELESLRASLANEKEAREKLEFELAARDVNDPALDEAIDKMQEGFKILQQHQSKRRKTT